MQNLKYYGILESLFNEHFSKYIEFAYSITGKCIEFPAIIIRHPKPFVVWTVVNKIVNILHGIEGNIIKAMIADRKGNCVNIVNISDTELNSCISTIRNISQHKNMVYNRHVIVLYFDSHCKSNTYVVIRGAMLMYMSNTCFIVVGSNNLYIPSSISVLGCRLGFTFKFDELLKDFAISACVSSTNVAKLKLHSDDDPINMCMLAEMNDISKYVKTSIDSILSLLSRPNVNIHDYTKAIRKFTVKISASCVPISQLGKEVVNYCMEHHPLLCMHRMHRMHRIVEIMTDMEHSSKLLSKEIFAIEYHIELLIKELGMELTNRNETPCKLFDTHSMQLALDQLACRTTR
jgi:hypothetical protein